MKEWIRRWARSPNWYIVAFLAEIFGFLDAITPGPLADRLLGLTVMAGAAWIWCDGGR